MLFEVATTLAHAWDHEDDAMFDFDGYRRIEQGRPARDYANNIFRNLNRGKLRGISVTHQERQFPVYEKLPYQPRMALNGLFQSEQYFLRYRERLLSIFCMPLEIRRALHAKYGDLLSQRPVAVHIRRGDRLKKQWGDLLPLQSLDYYCRAQDYLATQQPLLFFSDDIAWCKEWFHGSNFFFVEGEEDYAELYLISLCQDFILANSTFSWWGAWLCRNSRKRVIAPATWFKGMSAQHIYSTGTVPL